MLVLLTTIPGLEEIVEDELMRKIRSIKDVYYRRLSGRVYVFLEDDYSILQEMHELRCIERVILLFQKGKTTKDKIAIRVDGKTLYDFLGPRMTFMVRSLRIGEHCFSSVDLAAFLGENIQRTMSELVGATPEVSLSDPDIIFYLEVIEDKYRLGIDLTGLNALHKRRYKVYVHPSSLNPLIAYCMCKVADVEKAQRILDPMCGSGTILIECKYLNPDVEAWGSDINPQHIAGATINADHAGVKVNFEILDIAEADSHFPSSFFDVIITNPPFGIREKSIYDISLLYHLLTKKSHKLLRKNGVLCVLTPRKKLLTSILNKHGFALRKTYTVKHGGITSFIIVAVKS